MANGKNAEPNVLKSLPNSICEYRPRITTWTSYVVRVSSFAKAQKFTLYYMRKLAKSPIKSLVTIRL